MKYKAMTEISGVYGSKTTNSEPFEVPPMVAKQLLKKGLIVPCNEDGEAVQEDEKEEEGLLHDLSTCTVKELSEIIEAMGEEAPKRSTKSDLIELVEASESALWDDLAEDDAQIEKDDEATDAVKARARWRQFQVLSESNPYAE